jgi:hypothetical protein
MTIAEAQAYLATITPADDFGTFAAILVAGDGFADPEAILDYIEKPWKWAPEYAEWVNAGRPSPDDAAWDTFAAKLTALLTP